MKVATLCLLLLLTACGKVGEPLPPFIRIPEAVNDLAVRQDGNDLVLSWTNPPRYIDGSSATDLAQVQIRTNDVITMTVAVTQAGQPQSVVIPIGTSVEVPRSFSVQVETSAGKTSQLSNTVSVSPVAVPGSVVNLQAVVDQRRIILRWDKPVESPELLDGFRVTRVEPPETQVVTESRYEDMRYRPSETYTYEVTAMRGSVPGAGPRSVSIVIEDKTPPQVPAGLDIVISDTGAFITWSANTETDFAGYRLFRNGTAVSERPIRTNSFFDPEFRPGFEYAVKALDDFGNESLLSSAIRGL
jgi:hypothetical protein